MNARLAAICGMVLLAPVAAVAAAGVAADPGAGAPQPSRFQAERVVSFADVHGAYDELVKLLRAVDLVDEELAWQGGATHLVSLGDLMDRGPGSRSVLDLLRRLSAEAEAAGGRVHVVLGNHELMSLTGDLRYVSAAERAAFADLAPDPPDPGTDGLAGVRAAYALDGPYGAWLLQRPAAVVINGTAYLHGGVTDRVAELGPEGLNEAVRQHLGEMLRLQRELEAAGTLAPGLEVHDAADVLEETRGELSAEQQALALRFVERVRDPLFADAGPFWYRGNARCPELLEQPGLDRVFAAWDISRVVLGHTPTEDHRVRARLGGAVLLTDTGMLTASYGGEGAALILEHGELQVQYASGGPPRAARGVGRYTARASGRSGAPRRVGRPVTRGGWRRVLAGAGSRRRAGVVGATGGPVPART